MSLKILGDYKVLVKRLKESIKDELSQMVSSVS